jgi:hypothetical protein
LPSLLLGAMPSGHRSLSPRESHDTNIGSHHDGRPGQLRSCYRPVSRARPTAEAPPPHPPECSGSPRTAAVARREQFSRVVATVRGMAGIVSCSIVIAHRRPDINWADSTPGGTLRKPTA